jgi:hypothetical protein
VAVVQAEIHLVVLAHLVVDIQAYLLEVHL